MPSDLVRDLATIPGIVGNLGISIAEAQKLFDTNYVAGLREIVGILQNLVELGVNPDQTMELLLELAPSRYQYTETRLDFRADLAQSKEVIASGGLSAGYGGVAINAALTYGSRSDYRAAARVTTTLHGFTMDKAKFTSLLERAKENAEDPLPLEGNIRGPNLDLLGELVKVRQALKDPNVSEEQAAALQARIEAEKKAQAGES